MNISLLGDGSSHGGSLVASNQDGKFQVRDIQVCVDGATLACPIHGDNAVTAITVKSYCNSKLIITTGAQAACGAVIESPDRKVYIE